MLAPSLVAAVAVVLQAPQPTLHRNRPLTFVPGQVIVKMRTATPLNVGRLRSLGLDSSVRQLNPSEFLYRIPPATVRAMEFTQARDRTLAVVESLKASPDVEYVQPNYRLRIVGSAPPVGRLLDVIPNDTRWPDQWDLHNNGTGPGESPGGISMPKAWTRGTGSAGIVVSIIDTGILPNQQDISGSGNLVAGYDMISDPGVANDGNGRDPDPTDAGDAVQANECGPNDPPTNEGSSWHGTHVAGTIGAERSNNHLGVTGINWTVSVQAVRVLGKCGGSLSDIDDAIRWAAGIAVAGVPNNAHPARVINMSLGAPAPCDSAPALQSAIDDAVAKGVLIVVAAGNDGKDAANDFPASCKGVIAVAASDERGVLTGYSNFGTTVAIMAPGGDSQRDDDHDGKPDGILSTIQGGYAYYDGTSMATPHVAGVAALWLAQDPALSTGQVLAELQRLALRRTALQCPNPCGRGLLNAYRPATPPDTSHPPDTFPPPPRPPYVYSFAAKVICGVQRDSTNFTLARGLYTTAINIHNPGDSTVRFVKRIAFTHPPGWQIPGKSVPLSVDTLRPGLALESDCEDLRKRLGLDLLRSYVKGFIVLEASGALDVTAVYSAASLANLQVTSLDVESVAGRPHGGRTLPPPVTHSTGPLSIPQTYLADLDEGHLDTTAEADIWFEAVTATERYVTPQHGATIAIAGPTSVNRDGCMALTLSSARIPLSSMPVGTYVCVLTTHGRYSQFRVNAPVGPSPGTLVIGYTTWEAVP